MQLPTSIINQTLQANSVLVRQAKPIKEEITYNPTFAVYIIQRSRELAREFINVIVKKEFRKKICNSNGFNVKIGERVIQHQIKDLYSPSSQYFIYKSIQVNKARIVLQSLKELGFTREHRFPCNRIKNFIPVRTTGLSSNVYL